MNIRFDIDATPEELRRFFGLPDIQPLQEEMLEKLREKMLAGVDGYDPATLLKPFLPENMQSLEALQRHFWQQVMSQASGFSGSARSGGKDEPDDDTGGRGGRRGRE